MNSIEKIRPLAMAMSIALAAIPVAASVLARQKMPSPSPEQVEAIEAWSHALAVQAAT